MASEQAPASPTPPTWLEASVKYEGWGKAEFTDPPGVVEGPAIVEVSRRGRQRVTIDVETPPPQGALFYIKGTVPAADFRRHGMFNPCASVTVKTQDGEFRAMERILVLGGWTRSRPNRIRLRPLRSLYEVSGSGEPAYWVLPLSNFLFGRWPCSGQNLDLHPLRVTRPTGLAGEEREAAEGPRNAHDRLIVFEINGKPGFIEPLPDYERVAGRLRSRRMGYALTAVVVGPAHVPSVTFSDYDGLFPLDVVALLTLATGIRIGAPWVEFRDSTGQLVRRIHIPFGAPAYERGHAALSEHPPDALGNLLTSAFRSPERGKGYLRVATNQATASLFSNGTLESRYIDIVRAFETLCRHHGLGAQDLIANLASGQQAAVRGALSAAASQVRGMARPEPDPARARALDRIASRVANAAQRENDFGLAVVELLRRFGLPDADVLQPHLAAHPIAGQTNWPGLISFFRGSVAHEAYFDLPSGRHNLDEVLTVGDHLRDVLLRIIFKSLGYTGPYRPPIPPLPPFQPVDWVTTTTPAGMLGYYG